MAGARRLSADLKPFFTTSCSLANRRAVGPGKNVLVGSTAHQPVKILVGYLRWWLAGGQPRMGEAPIKKVPSGLLCFLEISVVKRYDYIIYRIKQGCDQNPVRSILELYEHVCYKDHVDTG